MRNPFRTKRTIVMIPGYNEPPDHFDILIEGKNGVPGLHAHGFECIRFPAQDDRLRERIDRFATFLDTLHAMGHPFPIVLVGYSLGGLVARGFLKAYPHRAHEISHAIMIGTPNWGCETYIMPQITEFMRVPDKAMCDMSLDSDFLRWLNGTGGHYVTIDGKRIWRLDAEPWVGPPGVSLLSIIGLIPERGGDNDGLVWGDSATLGSRIPAHFIVGPHCNHMNVIGHFDPLVTLSTGFLANDRVWPHTLRAMLRFTQAPALAIANG